MNKHEKKKTGTWCFYLKTKRGRKEKKHEEEKEEMTIEEKQHEKKELNRKRKENKNHKEENKRTNRMIEKKDSEIEDEMEKSEKNQKRTKGCFNFNIKRGRKENQNEEEKERMKIGEEKQLQKNKEKPKRNRDREEEMTKHEEKEKIKTTMEGMSREREVETKKQEEEKMRMRRIMDRKREEEMTKHEEKERMSTTTEGMNREREEEMKKREEEKRRMKRIMERMNREREDERKKHEEEKERMERIIERMNRKREYEMKKHEEEKVRMKRIMNREREEEIKKHEEEKERMMERMNRESEDERKKHEEEKERMERIMNRESEDERKKHEEEKESMKRMNRESEDERKKHEEEKVRMKRIMDRMNRKREDEMKKHEEEIKKHEEEKERMERIIERMNRKREDEMKKHEEEKERMERIMERMNRKREDEMKKHKEEIKKHEEEKVRMERIKDREREEEIKKHEEEKQRMKTTMEGMNREREEEMKKREEEKKKMEMIMERINREREDERKKHEEKERTKMMEKLDRERVIKKTHEDKERINREREEKMKTLEETERIRRMEEEKKRETGEGLMKHEKEKEKQKKSLLQGVNKGTETAEGRAERKQYVFHSLHLENRPFNKLRAADALQITQHSLQYSESCTKKEIVFTFIQKLLMMNYRARYMDVNNTNEKYHKHQRVSDSSEHEFDIFGEMSFSTEVTDQSERIDPMDVQMAVFHCSDGLLKQMMVTKLSQCQFALPLLVPDPDTQQIEFPLWTLRQIHKNWSIRNSNNEITSQTQPICKAQTPMVFFFRFGPVSSSKSQLMNSLINEKHNTFFHRNCPGSSRTRFLMDGVVEIAWFCPSGTHEDQFNDCVAFCNLRGDAGDHEKQLQILTEMASVNVVLLPRLDRNDKTKNAIQIMYSDRKPLICLVTEDDYRVIKKRNGKYRIGLKDGNQSDISVELRKAINDCLSESSISFRVEDMSKTSDIKVDEEDDEDCRRGRAAAQQMKSLLENKDLTEIKESFLPHQGKLWHQWSQRNRQLHRTEGDKTEMNMSEKHTEMKNIRKQQHKSNISEFMKLFIKEMNSADQNEKVFFLKWLRILLDGYTSADLSKLQHKYNEKWSTVSKLKKNHDKYPHEQTELEKISKEIQAATFGVEHIMRDIAQIYESCESVKEHKKDLHVPISSLPSLAAQMMISGFPLELMDGDAAHVPVVWISAVLDQLVQKLGDQRVFVLSVLGLQSSGKSTMLNAMFGLQFAVSAGRCTRGAFMQLVKVSQMKIDYILVVDTEGLNALELAGRSTRHHDKELATFIVGIAHLTLINVFGENLSEMQDILQIVVQAFMRMKEVTLNPSCVFVHQNISDITAGEKNMEGKRRLLEKLDEMTKLAAEEEHYDAKYFSDVIRFDVEKDVVYFAQIWEGNPPMAPPNPKYCENIQKLKKIIISQTSKPHRVKLPHFKKHINDLWEALLKERFVFSAENTLKTAAYNKLKSEYSKWSCDLRSAMMEVENKLHKQIENGELIDFKETNVQRELKNASKNVKTSMSIFFEKDTYAEILKQWKKSLENQIEELEKKIERETMWKLNEILQHQNLKKIPDQKKHH